MKRFIVARVRDVPEGSRLMIEVNGHSVGVFHVNGRYHAFLNRCPHQGAKLCMGRIVSHFTSSRPGRLEMDSSRKYLVCPWHGWEFDLDTGRSYFDPARVRARRYAVELEEGGDTQPDDGWQKGPYTASKLPVEVEDNYLVVVLP
jgi:3-phenylpropionate/trans-cinnamate dioxygenase ferredoxin subunit